MTARLRLVGGPIQQRPLTATPWLRGYVVHYRTGMICPGCGAGKWLIGRRSAECAGCGTALPLAPDRGPQ